MIPPELPLSPFRNEGLFANHYLGDVLPETPGLWTAEGLDSARDALEAIWREQAAKVGQYNEGQLEKWFIRPVLNVLGHVYQVQPTAGDHQPDYAFFADERERDSAEASKAEGDRRYWARALAVGDAKAWDRKLDRRLSGGAGWDFQNPSFQIYYYLAETGCRWAILTNGRLWRLYAGHPRPDMQVFYEVDLPLLLESNEPGQLAYFHLFFRREAFIASADGASFLDRVRSESDLAAERLRDDVRENVYRALLEACRGFARFERNDLTEVGLGDVYDAALVLLYRLLFILYAESAELLPVRENRQYRDLYSLDALKRKVTLGLESDEEGYLPTRATVWPQVKELFQTIDRGDRAMGIPAYNGGLFDAERCPLLERLQLADRETARLVRLLSQTPEGRFVDYRDLGVRHLGSIYEGLLEYRLARAVEPMAVARVRGRERWVPAALANGLDSERCEAGDLYLVTDKGERKASGSYYTPEFIVERIIEESLGPVVEACASREQILGLRVLDPAMGSGHFIVEATNFLARELLKRDGTDGPDDGGEGGEAELAGARRLVVERCIYGVDLNPLAVELAKLSLWLATVSKGQALSFLDHHLRCGNSLIGAETRELRTPPPTKKRATPQPEQPTLFDEDEFHRHATDLVAGAADMMAQPSATRDDVHQKDALLAKVEKEHRLPYREMADVWCSGRFGNAYTAADYDAVVAWLQGAEDAHPEAAMETLRRSREVAVRYRFFHWELEFPEVFLDESGRRLPDAGFDAVVGNPPWERIKLQENEFFALRDPAIALAPTAAQRKALVEELRTSNPTLWAEYERAKERADLELAWMRDSERFPLMGRGDTNLYAVMIERGRSLLATRGCLGFVVPSGIATDSTTSAFFADITATKVLHELLDFENREGAFAEVHRSFKYSIIVLTGGEPRDAFRCGFFLRSVEDLSDPEQVFELRPDDCALVNPNTRTCPVFRTRRDAELTRAIYERVPVLVRETDHGEENPWGVRYATMFHMTNDSGLFRTAGELESDGFYPAAGNGWRRESLSYLPLYEGKMVQMYDHRAAGVKVNPENLFRPALPDATSPGDHARPGASPRPQFWAPADEVERRAGPKWPWAIAFKDVTSPTNERTMIAAAVPWAATGNNLPLLPSQNRSGPTMACLLASLCCLPLDYVARQKVGGQHLNWFIVRQLPILPPERYQEDFRGIRLEDFVAERVLELTYTAHDIAGFAEDLGYVDAAGTVKSPFAWDEDRRLHLRCQLDALYFHLYGLTRDETAYVIDTFPITAGQEEEQYGRFRTRELVLHYWSAYDAGDMGVWMKG